MFKRLYPNICEDFRRRLKISEDVPSNSEVLKKMIMLHIYLKKIRDFGESLIIYSLHMDFLFLPLVFGVYKLSLG